VDPQRGERDVGSDPPGDAGRSRRPCRPCDSDLPDAAGGLRVAFKLALRQAEGLLLAVVALLGCEITVPDHTTGSRRAARIESITRGPLPRGPLHVLTDSTGLKGYGAGQWPTEKYPRSRRT
jgi:hypothetical protein